MTKNNHKNSNHKLYLAVPPKPGQPAIRLYLPPEQQHLHMGVFYKVVMLFTGALAFLLPSKIFAWITFLLFVLSCLNQPRPLTWRYPLHNVMFPVMLIALATNIKPGNNPIHQFLGWDQR